MAVTRRKKRAITTVDGKRVGTKRADTRWMDDEGNVWASKFEYRVWQWLRENRVAHRGTDPIAYTSAVKQGRCADCDSNSVVQDRTYTPDFRVCKPGGIVSVERCYYIEAKGYLRSEKRRLLRDFRKAWPALDLRLVVERDYKVTKNATILQWAERYLKCPAIVWNGSLPEGW